MKTKMLLLFYFEKPLLSLEEVCEHLFAGMSLKVMKAKLESGEIPLPVVQFGAGQKAPKYVAVEDLANYIDDCRREATKVLKRKVLDKRLSPKTSFLHDQEAP